jgi:hypothetical protein
MNCILNEFVWSSAGFIPMDYLDITDNKPDIPKHQMMDKLKMDFSKLNSGDIAFS